MQLEQITRVRRHIKMKINRPLANSARLFLNYSKMDKLKETNHIL